jgi:hypothetical protein
MSLSVRDKLGPFEIEALIGAAWARCTQPATRDSNDAAVEDVLGFFGMRRARPVKNSLADQL